MITKRQYDTYLFIETYIKTYIVSPSLKEIALGLGIKSKTTAQRNVAALVEHGWLKKRDGHWRNLDLIQKRPSAKQQEITTIVNGDDIPFLGKIAAGQPIMAIEETEHAHLTALINEQTLFMLQVSGNSMIELGINDQDFIICESRDSAENGEVAVVLIDNLDVTLKRIHWLSATRIELKPENKSMSSMVYAASRVQIQGILKWNVRKYY